MTRLTGATGGDATPAELADVAAEAIRALNHATSWRGGYGNPADVDAVIGHLHTLAARLGQALRQADEWIAAAYAAGQIGHDSGEEPGLAVDLLALALDGAAEDTARLTHRLDAARAESAHLTGITPPDDQEIRP